MTAPLNLRLCQEDSPAFRRELALCEESVFGLENTIKSLVKLAKSSVELATEYTMKQLQFAQELGNFANQQPNSLISEFILRMTYKQTYHIMLPESVLTKYSSSLQEVERSRKMLHLHMSDMFIEPLEAFSKNEIAPLKEVKKNFERASNEADNALSKYMSKRPKDQMIPEASAEVTDTRREFHRRYLEYVSKLNQLHAKKKFEFMEYILALMFTESAFYHQNYETMKDLEPYMKDVTRMLHEARAQYNNDLIDSQGLKKTLIETAHETYNPMRPATKELTNEGYTRLQTDGNTQSSVVPIPKKSGYLFKKGSQRVLQSWTRRYFTIEGEYLTSCTRNGKVSAKEDEDSLTINLRVCHIKPVVNSDRRFCFEIISPMRTYVLQAENQEEMDDWVKCLQTAAKEAIYADQTPASFEGDSGEFNELLHYELVNGNGHSIENGTNDTSQKANRPSIHQIMELPGNDICVDCKSPGPQWASTNFGTLLCIECSGIHRSLGVHVSKVRSLTLDKWEPEAIEVMLKLGNEKVNQIYEAQMLNDFDSELNRADWDKFIISKYAKKEFISQKDINVLSIHQAFWDAMNETDLVEALRYLSLGADVDYKNQEKNFTTALHQAILRSDDVAVEFLLQWFCDINAVDNDGWSGLHHAAAMNNARLLLNLMKRHANITLKDNNNKAPVDIALEKQHVQAVTALRLYQFESQLTHSEYSSFGVDEALTSMSKPSLRSLNLNLSTTNDTTTSNAGKVRSAPTTPPSSSQPNPDDATTRTSVDNAGIIPPLNTNSLGGRFTFSSLKLPSFGSLSWEAIDND
ncbi:11003_t:CDS:10 [Ambispora gerdemannii]|uniref:11003_t:CDS:1 n=1 Tax=Ambispora gerdemannii TaxID=144530 RepID=A0A9N8VDK7_9GLOM|nr:11003_t:CDS:10 [Ambispora gerdemannii]